MNKGDAETKKIPRSVMLVENAASYLAKGLTLDELRNQGNPYAAELGMILWEIDERHLGAQLEKRVKQLQQEASLHQGGELKQSSRQTDFLTDSQREGGLIPLAIPPSEEKLKPTKRRKPKQYTLEDLHKESRHIIVPREILQTAEAARSRRRFLKRIGYDAKGIKKIIEVASKRGIRRLMAAGVWEHIASPKPLDPATITLIQEKLRVYDAAHPPRLYYSRKEDSYVDSDSSDGATSHPSPEAQQTAQEGE